MAAAQSLLVKQHDKMEKSRKRQHLHRSESTTRLSSKLLARRIRVVFDDPDATESSDDERVNRSVRRTAIHEFPVQLYFVLSLSLANEGVGDGRRGEGDVLGEDEAGDVLGEEAGGASAMGGEGEGWRRLCPNPRRMAGENGARAFV